VDFLHKTVSAFFPDDRAKLFEALKGVIVKAIPANNRDGAIESLTRVFKEHMAGDAVMYFDIDDVGIGLTTAEDIVKILNCFDSLLQMLEKLPWDSPEGRLADLIRPGTETLQTVVDSNFPDLKMVRKHLTERGYAAHICGG
jgi:hypothetical protein